MVCDKVTCQCDVVTTMTLASVHLGIWGPADAALAEKAQALAAAVSPAGAHRPGARVQVIRGCCRQSLLQSTTHSAAGVVFTPSGNSPPIYSGTYTMVK